ncbi:MAG: ABC transporter ATP-binding protein [Oscillospiraceae bacterium]|nr:ABC transporter ATP-binding protein [Oscillospiraceae bacterium]
MKDRKTIAWLLQLNRKQWWRICLLAASMILAALLSVAVALLTRYVVDSAANGLDATFLRFAALLAAAGAGQILLFFLNRHLSVDIASGIAISMQTLVFRKLLRKDYAAIGNYHSGVLLRRLTSDVDTVANGMTEILPGALSMSVRLIAAFAVVCMMELRLALAFLAIGIAAMLAAALLRKKMKQLHRAEQETAERTTGFMQESLGNLLVIKTFGAEETMDARTDLLQGERRNAIRRRKRYGALMSLFMNTAFYGGYILGLIWGAVGIANHAMTFGMFASVIQLLGQIERPLTTISGYAPQLAAVLSSAERIRELLELPEETPAHTDDLESGLEAVGISGVTFSYDREQVLRRADFCLQKGEFAVLTGQSGIGKSTLMKLLLGVYKPTEGETYLQKDGQKLPLDSTTRSLFAYVPQGNFLLSGTIRENVCMVCPNAADEDVERALAISDAAEFVSQLPDGIHTVIGERGVGLSEGQAQRIAIARALMTDAPILLLDECTSALDEQTERRLLENLRSMTDKTCLLISHKKAATEICDSVYRVVDGKIERTGS